MVVSVVCGGVGLCCYSFYRLAIQQLVEYSRISNVFPTRRHARSEVACYCFLTQCEIIWYLKRSQHVIDDADIVCIHISYLILCGFCVRVCIVCLHFMLICNAGATICSIKLVKYRFFQDYYNIHTHLLTYV